MQVKYRRMLASKLFRDIFFSGFHHQFLIAKFLAIVVLVETQRMSFRWLTYKVFHICIWYLVLF